MKLQYRDCCPLCKSKKLVRVLEGKDRLFQIPGSFFVQRCSSCGLLWTEPQMSERTLSRYYPSQTYYSYKDGTKKSFLSQVRTLYIHEVGHISLFGFVLSHLISIPGLPDLQKKGTILDIGCGAGDTLSLLSEIGWETWGIDRDTKAIAFAKKRNIFKLLYGAFPSVRGLPKRYFDCIRLYCVLEHMNEPMKALRVCSISLRKDGEIILAMQNSRSLAFRLFGSYWYHLDLPRHRYHFNPYSIKKMLTSAGFTHIRISYRSMGGLAGSLDHLVLDTVHVRLKLVESLLAIGLFFPFEWLFDLFAFGDIMEVRAKKA